MSMKKPDPCEYCEGTIEPRIVRSRFVSKWGTIYVDDVPAEVCNQCGAQYLEASVVKRLEKIAKQASRIKKKISFPLAKYDMALS
jgi:YgiT-type zinc finger domain-containing protein